MKKLLALLFLCAHLTIQAQPLRLSQPTISEFQKAVINEFKHGKPFFRERITHMLGPVNLESIDKNKRVFEDVMEVVFRINTNKEDFVKYLTAWKLSPANVKALTEYGLYVFAKRDATFRSEMGGEPFYGVKKYREETNTWYYIVTIIDGEIELRSYAALANTYHKDKKNPTEVIRGRLKGDRIICSNGDSLRFRIKRDVLAEVNNEASFNEYFECTPEGKYVLGEPETVFGYATLHEVEEARKKAAADLVAEIPEAEKEPKEEIFTFVEQPPTFPGGDYALNKYLSSNIIYPKEAQEKELSGTVFVQFVVTKEGHINDAKAVHRLIGGGLEAEAVRVISAMPTWKAGKQNGKPTAVQFTLPIKFTLVDAEEEK